MYVTCSGLIGNEHVYIWSYRIRDSVFSADGTFGANAIHCSTLGSKGKTPDYTPASSPFWRAEQILAKPTFWFLKVTSLTQVDGL